MHDFPVEHFQWTRLPRGDVAPHWSGLYVSMNRKGGIVLSAVTHERLGSPSAYCIELEKITRRYLKLAPAEIGEKDAYPARVQGRVGAKIIRAYRITTQWNIRPPDTIEFLTPEVDIHGNLILDLHKIRISPKAHSQCRKKN
jgi:hypothetical protein